MELNKFVVIAYSISEVRELQYNNLQELISHSQSSRQYFLSLPAALQSALHNYNEEIHSAAGLRMYADLLVKYEHSIEISRMLL